MLVVSRFLVEESAAEDFATEARSALAALAARPGYRSGQLGRALDDPEHWCLVTEWESVGAYRRALSAYEVKIHATPLLARSRDEPSAYEVLVATDSAGQVVVASSDRAGDPHR
jgi:quinol monooxygenase YgiN